MEHKCLQSRNRDLPRPASLTSDRKRVRRSHLRRIVSVFGGVLDTNGECIGRNQTKVMYIDRAVFTGVDGVVLLLTDSPH